MSTQREITKDHRLLNSAGELSEPGWARQPYWKYSRSEIKAHTWRIKEWDYYYVLSEHNKRVITFTISDLGYAGMIAFCWLDLERNTAVQEDTLTVMPNGKVMHDIEGKIPVPGRAALEYQDNKISFKFITENGTRKLEFTIPEIELPGEGMGITGTLILRQPPDLESMNIATSWRENRKRFYYNRKINCMPVSGTVRTGNREYSFQEGEDFGGLDWGRGVWTYKNRWYWSSLSGRIQGKSFGFNLGYGFSDRSPASENCLIYNGRIHKLKDVIFEYDPADYMKPWKFRSNDKRLDLDFFPLVDRASKVDLLLIKSVQHQVFGRFSGTAILDDGTELQIKEMLGFAEDVFNRW